MQGRKSRPVVRFRVVVTFKSQQRAYTVMSVGWIARFTTLCVKTEMSVDHAAKKMRMCKQRKNAVATRALIRESKN